MISMQELLGVYKLEDQPQDTQDSLHTLLERVNEVREEWNQPMTVTSGLRSMEDHLRIYKEKAAKAGIPFDESKVPMASKHLFGKAVDIYDPGLKITEWLKANPEILENAMLWCEQGNSDWVHFQIEPPKSGKRWFLP